MRIEKDQVVALLIGAGVSAVFAAAVLMPLRYQRARYEARIAEAQAKLDADLKEVMGLAKLSEEVIELRQTVRGARQFVPREDELADVLRGLSEALDAYGIVERDVVTKTTQHYADYSVIPIELKFHASYPSAHGVLQRIERMQRLIRVDKMAASGNEQDAATPLEVKLALSTFIARPVELDTK